jgi:hypothetical protein
MRWLPALLVLLVVPGWLSAQPAVPTDPLPEAAPQAGMAEVTVLVQEVDRDFVPQPVEGTQVRLHIVRPPHEVLDTLEGTTDARGEARFRVPPGPGLEATAEVTRPERLFSQPIPLASAGPVRAEILRYGTTDDPSVVFASRVVTVLQPSEDFLMVQQVFHFGVDVPAAFTPDPEQPQTLLRIELPRGAKSIRVLQPGPQMAREVGGVIFLASPVRPDGGAEPRRPGLIVQYSLKHSNRSRYTFEQPLSLPVRSFSLVVPRQSDFARHPELAVELEAPICGTPGLAPDVACFAEVSDRAEGMNLNAGVQVRVARGGQGERGQRVVVHTRGWPSAFPWRVWLAGLFMVGGAGLFFGLWGWARLRHVALARDPLQRLQAHRERILVRAAQLQQAVEDGAMLEQERDDALTSLQAELAAVERRLREVASEADPGSPA